MWDKMVKGTAAGVGALAGLWGGLPVLTQTMALFMAADYITGLICAAKGLSRKSESGTLSSKAGFEGLLKKGVMLLVVLIAYQLDQALGSAVLHNAVVCFYIANEGISIMENSALLGVPWPDKLQDALEMIGSKVDKGEDKDKGLEQ